jgi:hypothetical protein
VSVPCAPWLWRASVSSDRRAPELSQGPEDVEDELAARCGSVDGVLQAQEANPALSPRPSGRPPGGRGPARESRSWRSRFTSHRPTAAIRASPRPVSQIPGVRASRETLNSRPVCETPMGTSGRATGRRSPSLGKGPLFGDDYDQEGGGVICGPAARIRGGVALNEAEQVATMKGISVIGGGRRSASSAADSGVYAALQKYKSGGIVWCG